MLISSAAEISVGYAFKSAMFTDDPHHPRLLRGANVGVGRPKWDDTRYWDTSVESVPPELVLRRDDIVIAMDASFTSAGELRASFIRDSDLPALLVQRVACLRAREGVDQRFLWYLVSSRAFTESLIAQQTGSVIAHVSSSQIGGIEIHVPPIAEQRAIAGVLGALDDKIESNRRLARIAHDLGSSTFDSVADSRLPLESVSTIVMGSSPPGSTYNEDGEGVPFYQGVADFGDRFPGIRVFCSEPVRMAKAHDVLVSVRAPVGRINIASQRCCIGRGLAAIRSELPSVAYYALTRSHEIWEPFNAEGTVFGAIKAADLGAIKVRWPSSEEAVALERELSEIDSTIGVAFNEVQTLTSLRNALLPELLSGRLRVRDAESFLEEEL